MYAGVSLIGWSTIYPDMLASLLHELVIHICMQKRPVSGKNLAARKYREQLKVNTGRFVCAVNFQEYDNSISLYDIDNAEAVLQAKKAQF